jgi:hypothetical protein
VSRHRFEESSNIWENGTWFSPTAIELAKVLGDRIVSDAGTSLAPFLFADRQTNGCNAWRFVWLCFLGGDYWVPAINCRARIDDQLRIRSKKRTDMYKTV